MRRLFLFLLTLIALLVAPSSYADSMTVSAMTHAENVEFSDNELNSTMMLTSVPQTMTDDGVLPSQQSDSFFSWLWNHPVISLLLLCFVLWILFYCLKRSVKYWV